MSRASRFSSNVSGFFPGLRKEVCLDFGSVNTRIMVDKKVVYEEPSCISLHKQSGIVVAIGQKALSSWKKTPLSIETLFPVQMGVIAHQEAAEKYLEFVLRKLFVSGKSFLAGIQGSLQSFSGSYSLGNDISPVERDIFEDVLKNVGLKALKRKSKTKAFYSRVNPNNSTHVSFCSLDIGGQTTEMGIFVEGKEVYAKTFSWGSFAYSFRIRQIVLAKYKLEISWEMAENIKKQIGQVFIDEKRDQKLKDSQLAIRGKDVLENSVKTLTVSAGDFASDFLEISQEFVDELRLAFDSIPVEIMSQALNSGFYLTGGGSKLKDLDTFLQAQFKCEVAVSKTPELDVVKGLGLVSSITV